MYYSFISLKAESHMMTSLSNSIMKSEQADMLIRKEYFYFIHQSTEMLIQNGLRPIWTTY
jgi:hypothetical protein